MRPPSVDRDLLYALYHSYDGRRAKKASLATGGDIHAIAQVIIRDSWLATAIKDAPWTDMSGFSWKEARLFEYNNRGPGAAVNTNRPQLTAEQAAAATMQSYLAGSDGWNPIIP